MILFTDFSRQGTKRNGLASHWHSKCFFLRVMNSRVHRFQTTDNRIYIRSIKLWKRVKTKTEENPISSEWKIMTHILGKLWNRLYSSNDLFWLRAQRNILSVHSRLTYVISRICCTIQSMNQHKLSQYYRERKERKSTTLPQLKNLANKHRIKITLNLVLR